MKADMFLRERHNVKEYMFTGHPAPTTADDHPLKGLWVVHNFYGSTPWQSIMDLSEDAALRINEQTANISCGVDAATGKETYYQHRLEVEEWDRAQHMARGGAVECENPVYAALTDKSRPSKLDKKGGTICFPAEWLDTQSISITFGESFECYDERNSRLPSHVASRSYSAAEFAEIISKNGIPEGYSFAPSQHSGTDFIEMRIFSRNLPTLEAAINRMSNKPDSVVSCGLSTAIDTHHVAETPFPGRPALHPSAVTVPEIA